MQVPTRIILLIFAAVICFAQQEAREPMKEESLTPEQFRQAHETLVRPRNAGADAATLTERYVAPSDSPVLEQATRRNFIDEHIFNRIERDGVPRSPLAGDTEFFRRVHLDLIGRIPTSSEVKAFLADSNPEKRSAKIDELLDREEFSEKWAYFYMNLFRANGKMGARPRAVSLLAQGESACGPPVRRMGAGHHHLGRKEQQRARGLKRDG